LSCFEVSFVFFSSTQHSIHRVFPSHNVLLFWIGRPSVTSGGPVPNPTFPTGGIAFGPATIVDPQRTEGEPLVHIDRFGNIWESGPWGFSTGQGFVAKSTDHGDSFHIVSPAGVRPNASPVGGGDSDKRQRTTTLANFDLGCPTL